MSCVLRNHDVYPVCSILKLEELQICVGKVDEGTHPERLILQEKQPTAHPNIRMNYRDTAFLLTRETHIITNPKEHSASPEAKCSSASQEIACSAWNLEVHYCVHKSLLLVSNLSHTNPVHALPSYF
jgi:hypothetical protein